MWPMTASPSVATRQRSVTSAPSALRSSTSLASTVVGATGAASSVTVGDVVVRVSSLSRLRFRRRWRSRRSRARSSAVVAGASVSPADSGSAPRPTLSPEIELASRPMPTAAATPAIASAATVAKRLKLIRSPTLAPPRQGLVEGRVSSRQSPHGLERHLGARAALRPVRERDLAAPARGQRLHHREAEPSARGAARAGRAAVEALEDAVGLVRIQARPLVEHG